MWVHPIPAPSVVGGKQMWLELWPSFPDLLKIPCEFTNLACVGMLSFIRVSCVFQRYIPSKTLRGCLIF